VISSIKTPDQNIAMTENSTMPSPSNAAAPKQTKSRRSRTDDVQDARPLLQAICLGIFLAAVLTAAAALADPNTELNTWFNTGVNEIPTPVSNAP
jgi:hypothetical protein